MGFMKRKSGNFFKVTHLCLINVGKFTHIDMGIVKKLTWVRQQILGGAPLLYINYLKKSYFEPHF